MVKKSAGSKDKIQPLEIITLLAAGFYLQSVLTVAHHTAYRYAGAEGRTVENPSITLLVAGILLVVYNCYKSKRLNIINTISLTILVTASIFWLSGLRANFFF